MGSHVATVATSEYIGERSPICCGKPMEDRLAQARDRLGQLLFVAIWRCPTCKRVILQRPGR